MNKIFCFIIIIAAVFTACSNAANYKETTSTTPATPTLNAPATPVTAITDTNKKGIITTEQVPPVTSTQTKTTTKNNSALNPAHGQPGHRCDIPEGAPLNSKPAINATIPATTNTATTKPVSQPAPPAKSNVKLNPAHGLPGHDCAIAVGQPLKS